MIGFYPINHHMNPRSPPEMTSCSGELLGRPMPLTLSGCAAACDQQTKPRCIAFQYNQIMDGEKQRPLCFLLEKVKAVRTYDCNTLKDMQGDYALMETKALRGKKDSSSKRDMC